MAFIQIMDFKTSDIDAVRKLDDEWEQATEGKRTARRMLMCRDRNDGDRYVGVIFFDSYESAMENSNLPETQQIAAKYAAATKDMTFIDLDVIEDRSA
jgi:hypothetical protein